MTKNNSKKKGYVINEEGEIIDVINEGDMITRAKSLEMLKTTQEWKIEHFYKGHINEIRKILIDLSMPEKALLFSIATYVGYEDCCLKFDNGHELTFNDIVEISGMSKGIVSSTINTLIQKDILYKGKNSQQRQYFVNPWLFCKGNRVNKVLATMFCNYHIRVLDGRQWKNVRIN